MHSCTSCNKRHWQDFFWAHLLMDICTVRRFGRQRQCYHIGCRAVLMLLSIIKIMFHVGAWIGKVVLVTQYKWLRLPRTKFPQVWCIPTISCGWLVSSGLRKVDDKGNWGKCEGHAYWTVNNFCVSGVSGPYVLCLLPKCPKNMAG